MSIYGRTWWGKKWLQSFNEVDYDNRLSRGRTYANTGRAFGIQINGNTITAKVSGSRPHPYKVKIILNELNSSAIRCIIENSPSILPKLINKQLPTLLFDKLNDSGIKLFPSNWEEMNASCNCPDWAMPCKHIAAVIYLIAAEIDKNPFVIFNIHNCDLLSLIDDFGNGKLENIQSILKINDLFKSSSKVKVYDQVNLNDIDLSTIPNLASCIENILTNNPLFFEKNFHSILQTAYKHWQKYPTGKSDYSFYSCKKKLSEEELFTTKWGSIEHWQTFQLFIDDQYQLIGVNNGIANSFMLSESVSRNIAQFLNDIPISLLHKLNPELRFMHMISQFARILMEKSALVPQILQNKRGEFIIRWIPALFNESVKEIHRKISSMCPPLLIQYQKTSTEPEEQVNIAISLILLGYMANNFPAALDKYREKNTFPLSMDKYRDKHIFALFFTGSAYKFSEFSNREIPQSINLWLSRLYLTDKPYKLYLMVKDYYERFELDIQVSLDDGKSIIKLKKALSNCSTKLSILSDMGMLSEYIPELERSIDESSRLLFSLDDFAPLFLNILPVLRAIGVIVILPKSLEKILKPKLSLNLSAKGKIEEDRKSFLTLEKLLKFDWKIAIGDKEISITEFKKLLKDSRGLIKIIDQYVLLDDKEVEALLKKFDKLPEHLSQAELMQAALGGELDGAKVGLDQQIKSLFEKLNTYVPVDVPSNLTAQLRPYQKRGFSWLVQNIETGFGSIIADDMGLGKTLQVIAAILYCKNAGFLDEDKVLVVAPTSILSNWQREMERFAPELKLFIYHGQNRELANDYDVALTSYGLARRDKKELNRVGWFLLVIDEAQNIKNPHSEQSKAIKAIAAKNKIAMSGTPVENRLLEYWSIFDFTNKYYLGTPKKFKTHFATPIEKARDKVCLEKFMKVTHPFMLRRVKSDKSIIEDLPDKIENNRYCSLTPEQTALYQEVVNTTMKKIERSEGIERKGLILKLINALKQVCNHPSHFGKKKRASIEQSGKMQILEEILVGISEFAEKSLIFTQYTEMGEIMVKMLEERFKSMVPFLHGSLSRKARDKMVNDFENSSQSNILIVSLKAGGTGLNLTAANHVIHYDLWWNPAVEAQATDRAYRIGQERNVMVYRLLSTGTFEERIDEMIQSKKELANLTISSGESWITEFSNNQLKDLINIRNAV
ncbi:MAG: DEAD/DEAH box helicase [Wolbachia endosymbiont of Homalodisca vitripennis]|nr:DEAD/DEAH box helicase [Wolbachia endosymbiont of Homalodisca vitripennis]MCJ7454554.1 DEAD/DEAH box helicase [Wolbachia endosymbiont of Homalodisca vitripennis]MCJ7475436.1 DEAD/DEAH box helicase [Wolbachia endosymbiont of Homalodisca vitripennis]